MPLPDLLSGEPVLFGTQVPDAINDLLLQAVQAYADTERAEALLWQAQRAGPEQLEVYIALYKFYFYKFRLREAEQVAQQTLAVCAKMGGFAPDWRVLDAESLATIHNEGPARVYLYTLKALGFIWLRQAQFAQAEEVLTKLAELDPLDQVGGSVIQSLLDGLREEAEESEACATV